jgi:hypothetical protein
MCQEICVAFGSVLHLAIGYVTRSTSFMLHSLLTKATLLHTVNNRVA